MNYKTNGGNDEIIENLSHWVMINLILIIIKGVNLVLEAVPVWPVEWYISVPVNTGVTFLVCHYFIYIYIYYNKYKSLP